MPRVLPTLLTLCFIAGGIAYNMVRYPELRRLAAATSLVTISGSQTGGLAINSEKSGGVNNVNEGYEASQKEHSGTASQGGVGNSEQYYLEQAGWFQEDSSGSHNSEEYGGQESGDWYSEEDFTPAWASESNDAQDLADDSEIGEEENERYGEVGLSDSGDYCPGGDSNNVAPYAAYRSDENWRYEQGRQMEQLASDLYSSPDCEEQVDAVYEDQTSWANRETSVWGHNESRQGQEPDRVGLSVGDVGYGQDSLALDVPEKTEQNGETRRCSGGVCMILGQNGDPTQKPGNAAASDFSFERQAEDRSWASVAGSSELHPASDRGVIAVGNPNDFLTAAAKNASYEPPNGDPLCQLTGDNTNAVGPLVPVNEHDKSLVERSSSDLLTDTNGSTSASADAFDHTNAGLSGELVPVGSPIGKPSFSAIEEASGRVSTHRGRRLQNVLRLPPVVGTATDQRRQSQRASESVPLYPTLSG